MQLYVGKNDQQTGPFTREQVEAMLRADEVTLDDLGWHAELTEWRPLREIMTPPLPVEAEPDPAPEPLYPGLRAETDREAAVFLYVPVRWFVYMCIASMGLYGFYWMYHNW